MDNIANVSSTIMQAIKEAADKKTLLQISYVDKSNKPSIRTVEPYEIKNGKLFAYCTAKDGIRAFNLENIQSAELHYNEYKPRFEILI